MISVECADARENAGEFALGILNGKARAHLLDHLEHCMACQALVGEYAVIADAFLVTVPEAEPPTGFEARLAAAHSKGRRVPARRIMAIAAAAALVFAGGFLTALLRRESPSHPPASHAPSQLAVASMATPEGLPIGNVTATARPTRSIAVAVNYGIADGDYELDVRSPARSITLGAMHVIGGRASFTGTLPTTDPMTSVAMVDQGGRVICSGPLPPASSR